MANISALLSKNADEYKRPPVLPEGTYYGTIKQWQGVTSSKKGTPGVQFNGTYTHADDDVGELVDDAGDPIDITQRPFYNTIYASEGGTNFHRVVKFLQELGINTEGRPLDQALQETVGMTVMISVSQKPNDDGELVNNIDRIAAA